jgi:hypothetical protein
MKLTLEAVEGNGVLVDAAVINKAASLSLSLVISPESMVKPITKKKRKEKSMADEVLPTTTSRVNDRLPKTKIKKGSRFKMQRKLLYHLCSIIQRRNLPGDATNTYNVYGNVTNGKSSKGWDVSFDLFPPENKIVRESSETGSRLSLRARKTSMTVTLTLLTIKKL